MKKLFMIGILALALCSCSKEEVDTTPKEVELKLDYTFAESGSMTRAGADVYGAFYDKYIKTKKLTPKTYSLTFKNKSTEQIALKISGAWGDNNVVRLPSGTYTVEGTSYPIINGYEKVPADSVYMKFKENIAITEDMTELELTADYDCYLLLFDTANTTSAAYNSREQYSSVLGQSLILPSDGTNFWLFVNSNSYKYIDNQDGISYSYYYVNNNIELKRKDTNITTIDFNGLKTEKGKYYYFNDMTNSFDIPPMESGN